MDRIQTMVSVLFLPLAVSLIPAGAFAVQNGTTANVAALSSGVASQPAAAIRTVNDAVTSLDDCYVCEGIWDLELGQWVPGSVRCDEALPEEDGKENCLDDQQGNECQIEQYEDCTGNFQEEVLLVQMPGMPGVASATTEWTFRTMCSASPVTTTTVHVVQVD
jgi:hypothetical protein